MGVCVSIWYICISGVFVNVHQKYCGRCVCAVCVCAVFTPAEVQVCVCSVYIVCVVCLRMCGACVSIRGLLRPMARGS